MGNLWIWLVVSKPLKNRKVNWDNDIPNIWKNKKVFQTTNQFWWFTPLGWITLALTTEWQTIPWTWRRVQFKFKPQLIDINNHMIKENYNNPYNDTIVTYVSRCFQHFCSTTRHLRWSPACGECCGRSCLALGGSRRPPASVHRPWCIVKNVVGWNGLKRIRILLDVEQIQQSGAP